MADYQSAYTGPQMDAVFRRVTDMQLGTIQITATMDGLGYAYWDAEPGLSGAVVLSSAVPTVDSGTSLICSYASYSSKTGQMFGRIQGDGVLAGETYTLHWLIIA